jgi:diguanylate cyclase (GGDEF)-like protein
LPRWAPLVLGAALVAGAIAMTVAAHGEQRALLRARTREEAVASAALVVEAVDERRLALQRLARRWQRYGPLAEADWRFEARLMLDRDVGVEAVAWLERDGRLRWIEAGRGVTGSDRVIRGAAPRRWGEVRRDRAWVSEAIDLASGGKGFLLAVPIADVTEAGGVLLAAFRCDQLLGAVLDARHVARGYGIDVFAEPQSVRLFQRPIDGGRRSGEARGVVFPLGDRRWRLEAWPGAVVRGETLSPLPAVGLVGGLLVALLATGVTHLARRTSQEAALAAREAAERRRGEEDLRANEEAVRQVQRVASDRELTFGEKVRALLAVGCQRFALEAAALGQVEGNVYRIREVIAPGLPLERGAVVPLAETLCRHTVERDQVVAMARVPPHHSGGGEPGFRAYLGSPIHVDGRIRGTLGFFGSQPRERPFTAADRELAMLMAQWLGAEIERRQWEEELRLLAELAQSLQACRTVAEALETVARAGATLFPADAGADLYLGSGPTLERAGGWRRQPVAGALAADECWALRLGRPRVADAESEEPRCAHAPPAGRSLCIPLVAQGAGFGLLHLAGAGPHWGPRSVQLAQAIGDALALALANLSLRERLREQSVRDPLTGLHNRRYLGEVLARELRRAHRAERPVSVLLLDLDHFKDLNDRFGHEVGDRALVALAGLLLHNVRSEDSVCRVGGEEVVIVLHDTDAGEAVQRAEHLRRRIAELAVTADGGTARLAASFGVASSPTHGATPDELLRAADRALYAAKAAGRNRVTLAAAAVPVARVSRPSEPSRPPAGG